MHDPQRGDARIACRDRRYSDTRIDTDPADPWTTTTTRKFAHCQH